VSEPDYSVPRNERLTKEQRINLINRRTVAWVAETFVISITLSPIAYGLYLAEQR
jgi:hypothetical protein